MDIERLKAMVMEEIDRLRPEMDDIAHAIHQDPEVGWETPRAVGRLADFMERHGLTVERGVAGLSCSFRAYPEERFNQRPAVCLLAEYDALPGLGHACSHNLIGTIAAGAGIAIARVLREADIPGSVYVMGTPFEEGGGGKIYMLDEGIFDVADVSFMWHGSNRVQVGSPNIAAQGLKFQFHGVEAHAGANPHEGINAADAAMFTFAAINALRQHVTSDVRIHGIITSAGDAPNTTPKFAEISLLCRARTRRALGQVVERVKNCARAGALATGSTLEIVEAPVYYERLIVPLLREVVLENLEPVGVPKVTDDPQTFASADSGNVSYKMPHVSFNLPLSDDPKCVPHTPVFAEACDTDRAREVMNQAAKIMARSALDLITNPQRLAAIQAQHRELLAKAEAEE